MTMITYNDIILSVLQEVQDLIIQSRHGSFLYSLRAVKITDRTVNFHLDIFFKPTFGLDLNTDR